MSNKCVALVVGASRGLGRQIAIDLARKGYSVVVAAKSTSDASKTHPFPPDPNSPQSTISTVVREIHSTGGTATAIPVDTRDSSSVQNLVDRAVATYGRLDTVIYNSGAIWWASVENTPTKRFKLMQQVNVEGLYSTIQAVLPYYKKNGWKGRIVVVSPPIYSRFFRGKTAYAMGKVGMSVLTKGLAMDFERGGRSEMAITSVWPATGVQSAATQNVDSSQESAKDLRKPTIFSDAVLAILEAPVEEVNGCLELDEDFLRKRGVKDFDGYSVVKGAKPRRMMPKVLPDLSVEEQNDEGKRMDSTVLRSKNAKL